MIKMKNRTLRLSGDTIFSIIYSDYDGDFSPKSVSIYRISGTNKLQIYVNGEKSITLDLKKVREGGDLNV